MICFLNLERWPELINQISLNLNKQEVMICFSNAKKMRRPSLIYRSKSINLLLSLRGSQRVPKKFYSLRVTFLLSLRMNWTQKATKSLFLNKPRYKELLVPNINSPNLKWTAFSQIIQCTFIVLQVCSSYHLQVESTIMKVASLQ